MIDSETTNLVCGVPWSSPFMHTDCVDSLLALRQPSGYRTTFVRGRGWCPAARHNDLCEKALKAGAELICILGADQVYEPDLLERLVSRWEEGYEVVSALIPTRGYIGTQKMKPFEPMAWRIRPNKDGDTAIHPFNGEGVNSDRIEVVGRNSPGGPMQRINFIGSGVLMFHADHLLSLKRPWFFETFDAKTYRRQSIMDTMFSWRLQTQAHAKLWCDTSITVKHLHTFSIDDTFQDRFDDWMTEGGESDIVARPNHEERPHEAPAAV